MQVTDEMLAVYKIAHRAAVDAALKDYSKIATVADDARREGIKAALAAALIDVPAVEPVGTVEISELSGGGGTRGLGHIKPDDWWLKLPVGTYHIYPTSPPLSREGEDSAEVERLTRPIVGIEHRTAQEAFDIMADRIRLAGMRSGSATTQKGRPNEQ